MFYLYKIRNLVANFNHVDLIPYKNKSRDMFSCDTLLFKLTSYFNSLNLKILFCKQSSIRDIFFHNSFINNTREFYFSKCTNNFCNVCSVSSSFHYIDLNGFILPLLSYSNCHIKECIYIIRCKLCINISHITSLI